jgi:2-keto-4-pentenoate hydratase/2-oxohepta-3-ene-1,7-dioic acid hydratase in catechol pathway
VQLVTIDSREVAGRPGAITAAGEILDLVAAPTTLEEAHWIPQSTVSILAAGEDGAEHVQRLLDRAAGRDARELRDAGVLLPLEQTRLMPPVRRSGLVLVLESALATDGEPAPVASVKSPNTVVGQSATVRVPWRASDGLDIRPLLGVVMGRPLYRAEAAAADAAIAAVTLLLDISGPRPDPAADAVAWRRYLDSKQFPAACPVGPALVTVDELPLAGTAGLSFRVNDVVIAQAQHTLGELPSLVAGLSRRHGFRPGDVIGFDLPGAVSEPGRFRDGDRVSLELAGGMRLAMQLSFEPGG